ncbi:hypothetical protein HELRODRAFT_169991 [Helobdella robusta]|uniref:Uncharacterized protein n=1 Tax=Helobdella robusta TaxID=6412 RepID=T1F2I1_HELRO|nr:hypothetical protein HELRODRAFT_169991 [Helobdella robusta]ESO07465.1 hypothetical protein HELRODRAFT_169991 [Helobdella robusta]
MFTDFKYSLCRGLRSHCNNISNSNNIPLQQHPTATPSNCNNIPLQQHPTAAASHCNNIPLQRYPTATTSHCNNIPLQQHCNNPMTQHFSKQTRKQLTLKY